MLYRKKSKNNSRAIAHGLKYTSDTETFVGTSGTKRENEDRRKQGKGERIQEVGYKREVERNERIQNERVEDRRRRRKGE